MCWIIILCLVSSSLSLCCIAYWTGHPPQRFDTQFIVHKHDLPCDCDDCERRCPCEACPAPHENHVHEITINIQEPNFVEVEPESPDLPEEHGQAAPEPVKPPVVTPKPPKPPKALPIPKAAPDPCVKG